MKKKKKGFFESVMDFIVGSGKDSIMDAIKDRVTETIDEAEIRLEKAIKKVLSMTAIFLVVFLGLIFVLVGISKYLTETVQSLEFGVGYIVVGAVLIILALLFRISNNSNS